MKDLFHWRGAPIAFGPGDTVASALWRQGIADFGTTARAGAHAVFCGIGQCQVCLVMDHTGRVFEACLHRPPSGAHLFGVMDEPASPPALRQRDAPSAGNPLASEHPQGPDVARPGPSRGRTNTGDGLAFSCKDAG
jgi:hypothetical protein